MLQRIIKITPDNSELKTLGKKRGIEEVESVSMPERKIRNRDTSLNMPNTPSSNSLISVSDIVNKQITFAFYTPD